MQGLLSTNLELSPVRWIYVEHYFRLLQAISMLLKSYPSLSEEEFEYICQLFEQRCNDKLDTVDWLGVNWTGSELRIKQSRTVHDHNEAVKLTDEARRKEENIQDEAAAEEIVDGLEEIDNHELMRTRDDTDLLVHFSITLSPTYSVPVLWFSSPQITSIDDVYQYLIPRPSTASLRTVGIMGGISMAYHPVTDLPAFFLHPCKTQEALIEVTFGAKVQAGEYLMLWLGLIGAAIGLHIPSNVAAAQLTASVSHGPDSSVC